MMMLKECYLHNSIRMKNSNSHLICIQNRVIYINLYLYIVMNLKYHSEETYSGHFSVICLKI